MKEEFIRQIECYQGILQRICNVYFYHHPYKEDYYQEIIIRLWKAYPLFKKECAFSTWLYRVALNTAIDLLRKESVQPVHQSISPKEYELPYTPDSDERQEEREQLYHAINRLPDVDKAIILLYLEENEYKEIAAVVGISADYVGVKINRIKKQLMEILRNERG